MRRADRGSSSQPGGVGRLRVPAPSPAPTHPSRKKILVMGLRRSGKTSCQQVVFHGLPPPQAFYLDPTIRVSKSNVDSIIALQLWDCPGSMHIENLDAPLSAFSTIIFVVDIQDDYHHPIAQLVHLVAMAHEEHRDVNFEVFVHKSEAISEEYKIDNFRQLQTRILDELIDHALPIDDFPISFYLTSVHDHSVYEAWSRVIQKLVDPLPTLENMTTNLCSNSGIAKAFLFDVKSLIYVVTDTSPTDAATHGVCCEYLKTQLAIHEIYKGVKSNSTSDHTLPITSGTPTSQSPPPSMSASITSTTLDRSGTLVDAIAASSKSSNDSGSHLDDPSYWASSSVYLKPETTLAYWQITNQLSLVALVRSDTYESKRALIEYNVTFYRRAIHRIVEMEMAKWPVD